MAQTLLHYFFVCLQIMPAIFKLSLLFKVIFITSFHARLHVSYTSEG